MLLSLRSDNREGHQNIKETLVVLGRGGHPGTLVVASLCSQTWLSCLDHIILAALDFGDLLQLVYFLDKMIAAGGPKDVIPESREPVSGVLMWLCHIVRHSQPWNGGSVCMDLLYKSRKFSLAGGRRSRHAEKVEDGEELNTLPLVRSWRGTCEKKWRVWPLGAGGPQMTRNSDLHLWGNGSYQWLAWRWKQIISSSFQVRTFRSASRFSPCASTNRERSQVRWALYLWNWKTGLVNWIWPCDLWNWKMLRSVVLNCPICGNMLQ